MYQKKLNALTYSAMIASLYVLLTYISHILGLANGAIQLRLSEALAILPCFTPSAIPGLFVGCIISNLLTGCAVWDIIFGSFATLIGAVFCYLLRKRSKWLSVLPNILSNSFIVPFILIKVYGLEQSYLVHFVFIFIGELISCGALGMVLYLVLDKNKNIIFRNMKK